MDTPLLGCVDEHAALGLAGEDGGACVYKEGCLHVVRINELGGFAVHCARGPGGAAGALTAHRSAIFNAPETTLEKSSLEERGVR